MHDYRSGEVVLLAFPFADATGTKRRPALVLLDMGDDDILVARLTTQAFHSDFNVELTDWRQAGLLLPSVVRVHKLATVEKRLVERRLGALSASDWEHVRDAIRRLWASP